MQSILDRYDGFLKKDKDEYYPKMTGNVMKEIRALKALACIAQSVERQPFKLVVVGSSPTAGVFFILFKF